MIGALFSMTMEINVAAWPIIFSSLASKQEIKVERSDRSHNTRRIFGSGHTDALFFGFKTECDAHKPRSVSSVKEATMLRGLPALAPGVNRKILTQAWTPIDSTKLSISYGK